MEKEYGVSKLIRNLVFYLLIVIMGVWIYDYYNVSTTPKNEMSYSNFMNEVLKMATLGGARAMGLRNCDTLSRGKLADLIVIDLNQPNMQPINNITKNLVYSGSKQNVVLTMVNGNILYEKGEFNIGEEPEKIYETANKMLAKIK